MPNKVDPSAARARRAPAPEPRAWQRMLSGKRLNLLNPTPLDIEISDIAHGLSRVARWNGQTTGDWPFSVADHSLLVEDIYGRLRPSATREERLIALLHDAPEYVIGDLISPFKAMIGGEYKTLEERLLEAVLISFGLSGRPDLRVMRRVKRADKVAAYVEAVSLAGFGAEEAARIFGAPKDSHLRAMTLEPRTPNGAKEAFLARFEALSA